MSVKIPEKEMAGNLSFLYRCINTDLQKESLSVNLSISRSLKIGSVCVLKMFNPTFLILFLI